MEDLLKRITMDPKVMVGKPVMRGTRIMVDLILEPVTSGMTPEEIAKDYRISVDDVRAALLYAAKVISKKKH
ncbi:MAG: DUF433 domain-containing protein [Candidatus Baldrarchaeia archaeon]